MEAARTQLDVAVRDVCSQHDPLGFLPFVLALATGAIVGIVTAGSVRAEVAALLSIGAAAGMFVVLTFFRVTSWMRHHPLLAQMYKQDHDRADADTVFDPVGVRAVIVRHYLPKEEAESLLTRLEDAKHRTLNLLEPNDHSGTEGQSTERFDSRQLSVGFAHLAALLFLQIPQYPSSSRLATWAKPSKFSVHQTVRCSSSLESPNLRVCQRGRQPIPQGRRIKLVWKN